MNKSRNFSESPCFFPQVRYNISTQIARVEALNQLAGDSQIKDVY